MELIEKVDLYLNEDFVTGFESVGPIVKAAWEKYFKNTYVSDGRTALQSDDYSIYKFYLGKDKSEFKNGIPQNDPLSLMITVDTKDGMYVVEFNGKSISVNPTNQYMAYGTHKFKLRKFKAKTVKELEKKLGNVFKKIHDDIKKLLSDGMLDVHGDDIVNMVKGKIK